MSLKDAIREAVDERDKQKNEQVKPLSKEAGDPNPLTSTTPPETIPPAPKTNTASNNAVKPALLHTAKKAEVKAPREKARITPTTADEQNTNEMHKSNTSPVLLTATNAVETSKPTKALAEETAAMTVRVSRRHRLHWLISAKQQGTSLTAAITEAMNARFGEPDH